MRTRKRTLLMMVRDDDNDGQGNNDDNEDEKEEQNIRKRIKTTGIGEVLRQLREREEDNMYVETVNDRKLRFC